LKAFVHDNENDKIVKQPTSKRILYIMVRSMLGGNETILGMGCSSKVQQLKLCGTFVQFIKERKIKDF